MTALDALFNAHAPSLDTRFSDLPKSLQSSPPVVKLGFDERDLRHEFEKWSRERKQKARRDFDDMLRENNFVEFWGRAKKLSGEATKSAEADEDEEGEEGGGKADLVQLAKGVDIEEVQRVLQV